MELEELKKGQIIYFFSLGKFGGMIWNINYTRVKITKINKNSARINRLDDNNGKGNDFNISMKKFNPFLRNCFLTKEEAFETAKEPMKKYAEVAQEQVDWYTNKHKDYDWYVYTRDIINDFSKLLDEGFDEEKYQKVKDKYKDFENGLTKRIFGVE